MLITVSASQKLFWFYILPNHLYLTLISLSPNNLFFPQWFLFCVTFCFNQENVKVQSRQCHGLLCLFKLQGHVSKKGLDLLVTKCTDAFFWSIKAAAGGEIGNSCLFDCTFLPVWLSAYVRWQVKNESLWSYKDFLMNQFVENLSVTSLLEMTKIHHQTTKYGQTDALEAVLVRVLFFPSKQNI